jgi:hypothetical protein
MVSTRNDPRSFAIEAWDMVGIHGWNSEDRKLFHANPVVVHGPSVLTGVHQRGWLKLNTSDTILWEQHGGSPLAIRDSVLNGNVNIHGDGDIASGTDEGSNLLSNV